MILFSYKSQRELKVKLRIKIDHKDQFAGSIRDARMGSIMMSEVTGEIENDQFFEIGFLFNGILQRIIR